MAVLSRGGKDDADTPPPAILPGLGVDARTGLDGPAEDGSSLAKTDEAAARAHGRGRTEEDAVVYDLHHDTVGVVELHQDAARLARIPERVRQRLLHGPEDRDLDSGV